MRLDVYLATYWPEHSRSVWQKYITSGYVFVNDEIETIAKRILGEDDVVTFTIPEKTHDELTIPIIFKDEHVVVIDKPVGVLSHSKGALNEEATVASWLTQYLTEQAADAPIKNRDGIVHRLDRDTSGVMICARDPETASFLQKQFSSRKVKKTYYAVVEGVPKVDSAVIDLPIARNPSQPNRFRVDPNGKPATTRYKVVKTNGTVSLLELKPTTGRTHQLRVHLQYIGTPIIGDRFYGEEGERLYLHAGELEITIPGGIRKTFTSAVPQEFYDRAA